MRSRAFVVLGVLSTALVAGGWLVERGLDGGTSVSGPRLFDEVMTHIERYYVDSVSTSDLYGKAIDGMLEELHDPHSVFLRADRLARLNESTTGNYGGVGIQIDVRDEWVIVVSALPGTPAERAGIETGDRIVEVAEALGQETDFVRVDLYETGDRVVFGELTNYPSGGEKNNFTPPSYDDELGRLWTVPRRYE